MRFIGDIHGEYGTYFQTLQMTTGNSVQVGDFGIGFGPVPENILHAQETGQHRFIRGNHDNPNTCPLYRGYITDGTIETFGNTKVMYIGGAMSIDKDWRTPGVTWWHNEELSYADLMMLTDKYTNEKPDIMITHECPDGVVDELLGSVIPGFRRFPDSGSITRDAFQRMLELHKPKIWIFGHWHENIRYQIGPTLFVCLGCHSYIDVDMQTGSVSEIGSFKRKKDKWA